jgi:hypothetical protein
LQTVKKIKECNKNFYHYQLRELLDNIVNSSKEIENSDIWITNIQNIIVSWQNKMQI